MSGNGQQFNSTDFDEIDSDIQPFQGSENFDQTAAVNLPGNVIPIPTTRSVIIMSGRGVRGSHWRKQSPGLRGIFQTAKRQGTDQTAQERGPLPENDKGARNRWHARCSKLAKRYYEQGVEQGFVEKEQQLQLKEQQLQHKQAENDSLKAELAMERENRLQSVESRRFAENSMNWLMFHIQQATPPQQQSHRAMEQDQEIQPDELDVELSQSAHMNSGSQASNMIVGPPEEQVREQAQAPTQTQESQSAADIKLDMLLGLNIELGQMPALNRDEREPNCLDSNQSEIKKAQPSPSMDISPVSKNEIDPRVPRNQGEILPMSRRRNPSA